MAKRSKKKKKHARIKSDGPSMAETADRHVLYEAAVQCVEAEIDFVDQEFQNLRGRRARTLREDFCGTASTSCEWVRRHADNSATGVDLDSEVLQWGTENRVANLAPAARERITLIEGDVMRVETALQDIVLAMNFSYFSFKERAQLRSYFRRTLGALIDDGVFFLDCYGGYDAFRELNEHTEHKGFTYVWDQAFYNPVNGHTINHIHFRFDDGSRMKKAFSYDWRLWTLPEIREILMEAGFSRNTVYWQGWDEDEEEGSDEFEPVETADADAGWICYIAAVK